MIQTSKRAYTSIFGLTNFLIVSIVEAYTFNFHVIVVPWIEYYVTDIPLYFCQYHTIPGTSMVVPIMSYGNRLQKTPSRDTRRLNGDPVAEAILNGKVPTLRDVKRSVKVRKISITCWELDHRFLVGIAKDIDPCHGKHGSVA
jgi:hypothetical protein